MPNLMYHFVGLSDDLMGVSLTKFRRQLDFLEETCPREEIVLTFDHGTIDHINMAAPELEKRGLKGIFFLLTMVQQERKVPVIDKQRRLETLFRTELPKMLCAELGMAYRPESAREYLSEFQFYSLEERYLRYLRDERVSKKVYEEFVGKHFLKAFGSDENFVDKEYLGWHHVEQLHERGHIIGSHSYYHQGDKEDFERSLKVIEKEIGVRPKYISYPNGVKSVSDEDLRELKIEMAYLSSEEGGPPYRIPRIDCNQFPIRAREGFSANFT